MTTLRLVQGLGLLMELCLAASLVSERSCSYGSDCVLTCAALNKPAVQYRDVRWYKETPDRRNGLLMRSLPNGPTRLYVGLSRQVDVLEDSWSILLPNVSTGDSGTYVCRLAAPVGQQNQEGRVQLAVTGDPDGPPKFQEIMFVVLATIMLFGALLLFMFNYAEQIPAGSKVEGKAFTQSEERKCRPVFLGGTSVPCGVGSLVSQRSCDQLRCTSCDFRVLMFEDQEWDTSCDYLFLRNNMPDVERLRGKLRRSRGRRAYACQCSWFSARDLADLSQQPQLRWVCGKHPA